MPSREEIETYVDKYVTRQLFQDEYANVFSDSESGMPFLLNKVKIINGIKTLPIFKTHLIFDALGDDLSIEPLKDLKVLAKFRRYGNNRPYFSSGQYCQK